jgi:hypothetical protein
MKVFVQIGHPAHVQFFKNIIRTLTEHGHSIRILARRKDVTLQLLDRYGFDYIPVEFFSGSMAGKMMDLVRTEVILYRHAKAFRPDLMIASGSPAIAHVGKLLGIPSIFFTDTEDARLANSLARPFATVMCTPRCFRGDLGPRHIRFNGFKELAYLHPKYFTPDPSVLQDMGIREGERFIIVRLISWEAHHDIGLSGIRDRKSFLSSLERFGRVFLSSERELDPSLEKYRIRLPPDRLHSLMAYASLYIGEGGTMAAEAAVLGTPSIHIEKNSSGTATGSNSGNFLELRDTYDLLYFYPDQAGAMEKAMEILHNPASKAEWMRRRERLYAEKVDVPAWFADLIEHLPQGRYMKNP